MIESTMTCPLCSTSFEASERAACTACPVGKDCSMVCCPTCGHTTIDPRQSRVASWISKLVHSEGTPPLLDLELFGDEAPLTEVKKGQSARVLSLNGLPLSRQRYLSAFGIIPGAEVMIRQQKPVTIIEIDRTELALENELAEKIRAAVKLELDR